MSTITLCLDQFEIWQTQDVLKVNFFAGVCHVYAIAVLCRAGVCHVYMQQLCSALWVFVMCICYSCVLSFRCLSCVYALAGFCLAGVCHVYMQQLCSVLQVFGAVPRDQTIGFPQGSGGQSANVGHFYASVLPFL